MPDRRPSRAERRRYVERTGRRPARERPIRPFEQDQPGEPAQGAAPTGTATVAPPVRTRELAPSAARSVTYLHHREQQIKKDLRGVFISWVLVIALFAGVVVYLNTV
jgi:hypothetical protein